MISKSGSNEEAMVSETTLCFLYSTICFDKRIDEAGRQGVADSLKPVL